MLSAPSPARLAPREDTTRRPHRERLERLVLALLLAALGLLLLGQRWHSRQQVLAVEGERLAAQVRAIEQNLTRELGAVRAVLQGLSQQLPRWPAEQRQALARAHMRAVGQALSSALKLQWMDADGTVLVSNLADMEGHRLQAREYFQRMQQQPVAGQLVVSQPFNSVLGLVAMNVSLPLLDENGRFDGAVAATVDPAYFSTLLGSVRYAADMRALVVHGGGRVLVAEPVDAYPVGVDLSPPHSMFSRHLASGQAASVLTGSALADAQPRQAALRTLRPSALQMDSPLVLVVSRSVPAMLAGWQQQSVLLGMAWLMLTGLSLLGLGALQRRRREAEDARRREADLQAQAADRLALALQGGDLGLWDLHLPSGHCTVNERWHTMLGLQPGSAEAQRADWLALLHPEDREAALAAQQAHIAGHTPAYEATYRLRHTSGHWVWVLDRGRVVERDAQGQALRMVGTHMDISERHRAEAERQLLERHLREAQKIESIGTLAGGIAHDFNNILAAILGNLGLARADLQADHPAQAPLAQIHQAGQRARSLVQQILTFSRQQRGEPRPVALLPVLRETLSMLRATLPVAVRLEERCTDQALGVMGDATQLHQVLMNLGTNAWHALPEGRGCIELGLEALPAAPPAAGFGPGARHERWVHLWVRDNGLGMDEATRQRIFDPFFTTKPVGQGTGLGLSVVHGIVRAHHGFIEVDTQPGQGSCFHVYLPLSSQAVAPDGATPLPAPDGQGRAVLYVDDDEVMVLMVTRLLERAGWVATGSLSAADALARLHGGLVCDVVVSDFNMPEASGLELADQLRRQWPGLPVVISSGYISENLQVQSQRLGVKALLHKENTLEELPGLLAQVLEDAGDAAGDAAGEALGQGRAEGAAQGVGPVVAPASAPVPASGS